MSKGLRAIVGVAAIVLGATILWPLAGILYPLGASLILGAVLEKTPKALQNLQSQSVMVRSAVKPQELVFGTTRKSGVVVWFDTSGTENEFLWFVVAVCEHEISGYTTLWLDDTAIDIVTEIDGSNMVTNTAFVDADGKQLVKAVFYTGESSQVADADLVSAFSEWTTDHKGNDVAYFYVRLELDKSKGGTDPENPSANVWHKGWPRDISVTLTGAKVYNPSGSGHLVDDSTTWQWSNNPILCRAHYLRHDRFGPGYTSSDIDWTVVATQASICNEAVTLPDSSTQARYTLDGVISLDATPKAIVESMQTADFGVTLFFPGNIELHAGAWDSTSHTIDETWVAGSYSATSATETDDAYNGVRGQYLSADDDYTLVEFNPRTSSAYETEDGVGRVWQDIVLPFTTDELRAQRMAIIELKRSRQQIIVNVQCNFRAELVNVYETVVLDLPGFSSDTFRVLGKASSTDGTTTLQLREEVSTDWDFTIPELAEPPVVPTVSRSTAVPPAPSGLTTSSVPAGVQLFWDNPEMQVVSHIEVYASATNDRATATIITKTASESYFHELSSGAVRYYWILARGTNNLVSEWHPVSDPDTGLDGVSGTAGSSGVDGLSIIIVNAYLRKASAPTQPIANDGSYDFDTHTLTPPSTAGGSADDWYDAPPSGTDPLYVTSGTFSIIGQSGTDPTVSWTSPDLLVTDGAPGDSVHVANVYVRSPTDPATPAANDGSYDFGTQTLTPPSVSGGSTLNWSAVPPTGSDPLYVSSGTFSVSGTTGTDNTVAWSSPDLITHDGAGFVPDFSPGYVGGLADFVYTLNMTAAGVATAGEIRVAGTTFEHPDGTTITLAANPTTISTPYSGSTAGRFFIMYTATSPATRFSGWSGSTPYICITYDDTNGWRARDSAGAYYAMTVVATDCIIAICTKASTSAGSGIETIQVLTAGLAGATGDKGDKGDTGSAGSTGLSILTASVYKRASSAPSTPSLGSGSYDFTTKVLTPPTGWSASVPAADGNPLYSTHTTFSSTTGSGANDNTPLWSTPAIMVQEPIFSQLTNASPTVSAASDGTGYSLTNAGGTHTVTEGTVDRTTSAVHSIVGGSDGGANWTKVQNGLTLTVVEATGVYSLSGSSWTSDSETFTLRATYNGVTTDKVYTITKVSAGSDGSGGGNVVITGGTASKTGTTPWAQWQFSTDGDEYSTVEGGSATSQGTWLLTGAVGDYEIYAYIYSESGTYTMTGTLDSWLALSSSRSWRIDVGVSDVATVSLKIEIRNATSKALEASGFVTLKGTDTT